MRRGELIIRKALPTIIVFGVMCVVGLTMLIMHLIALWWGSIPLTFVEFQTPYTIGEHTLVQGMLGGEIEQSLVFEYKGQNYTMPIGKYSEVTQYSCSPEFGHCTEECRNYTSDACGKCLKDCYARYANMSKPSDAWTNKTLRIIGYDYNDRLVFYSIEPPNFNTSNAPIMKRSMLPNPRGCFNVPEEDNQQMRCVADIALFYNDETQCNVLSNTPDSYGLSPQDVCKRYFACGPNPSVNC